MKNNLFNYDELKQTILTFKKDMVPAVVIESDFSEALDQLEDHVTRICSEIGVQVICERDGSELTVRNLFHSNN